MDRYLKIIGAVIAGIFAFEQVAWADTSRHCLAPQSAFQNQSSESEKERKSAEDSSASSHSPLRLPETTKNYWQKLSGGWEATAEQHPYYNLLLKREDAIVKRVEDFIRRQKGKPIVIAEFCCGKGRLFIRLANLDGVQRAVAVDINQDALQALRKRLAANPMTDKTIDVFQGDLNDGDLKIRIPESDVIVINDALMHMANPAAVMDLISSRLKPGGLFIGNFTSKEGILWRHPLALVWLGLHSHVLPWLLNRGSTKLVGYLSKLSWLNLKTYPINRQEAEKILNQRFEIMELITTPYATHEFVVSTHGANSTAAVALEQDLKRNELADVAA